MRLVLLFCLTASNAAFAWGPAGHQTIGALADRLIQGTPAATQVRQILGGGLRAVSMWADCAKGVIQTSPGQFEYTGAGHYPECRPFETTDGIAAMVDYVSRNWSACHPTAGQDPCHKQYHYADVAIERDTYSRKDVGTSDHDIVSAMVAAIDVLQGRAAPAPFSIANKREALLLLVHFAGDIHQPLHVAAIYLSAAGAQVDPDAKGLDPTTETRGGNKLIDGKKNLHAEWDTVTTSMNAEHLGVTGVALARKVPPSAGNQTAWPAEWATDTLYAGKAALAGIQYSAEDLTAHTWQIAPSTADARARRALQREQLIKGGARLAQLLEEIFPKP